MPNPSPEYHTPGLRERIDAAPLTDGTEFDLHKSNLTPVEQLTARAMGAATQTGLIDLEQASNPLIDGTPKEKEQPLAPWAEVSMFGKRVISYRNDALDRDLLADNPRQQNFLDK